MKSPPYQDNVLLDCLAPSNSGQDDQDVAGLQDLVPIGVLPVDEKGTRGTIWNRNSARTSPTRVPGTIWWGKPAPAS